MTLTSGDTSDQRTAVLGGCTQKCLGGTVEVSGGLSSGGVGGTVVVSGGATSSTDSQGRGGNVEVRGGSSNAGEGGSLLLTGGFSDLGMGGDVIVDAGFSGTANTTQEGLIRVAPTRATIVTVGSTEHIVPTEFFGDVTVFGRLTSTPPAGGDLDIDGR